MDAFKEKFQIDQLLIQKVGAWNISLRPKQVTLGSLVLSLDRKCPEMADMSKEEGADLSKAFKTIEKMFENTFQPQKLNYLALMMVDHQVHFHVIPRYENAVDYEGEKITDKDWPKPPQLSNTLDFDAEKLKTLKDFLKAKL